MESFLGMVDEAWTQLSAGTPLPAPTATAAAVLVGVLAAVWTRTWLVALTLVTIAHEGGHALAAVVTGSRRLRVHVNADGSGSTHHLGHAGRFRTRLVAFAGYPAPAVVGAGLLIASVSGVARVWAAATALALALLLCRTRNLHGSSVIGLCFIGTAAAAWFLPGVALVLGMACLGAFLVLGALRALGQERRARRTGATDSDVSSLGRGGSLPAGFWWTAMAGVVVACGWIAWGQLAEAYAGP